MLEIGGIRELQKYDAGTRKFVLFTADAQEIQSFLRVHSGLPPPEGFSFFVLGSSELPSQRMQTPGSEEVRRLEQELRITREYEDAQDRLFRVQTRLTEIGGSAKALSEAEEALANADAELARSPWTAQQIGDLAARARRAEHDAQRRDMQIEDISRKRERATEDGEVAADPFWLSPWFNGGLFVGVAIDVVALLLGHPALALIALIPFLAPLVAVLRYIQVDEERKHLKRHLIDLKEQEQAVHRRFKEEQATLKAAMQAVKVGSPAELLVVLEQRNEAAMRREEALAHLERIRNDAAAGAAAAEIAKLREEKAQLEQRIATQGFARALADVEADLHKALQRSAAGRQPPSEAVQTKGVLSAAAGLLEREPAQLFAEAAPRLAQFLAALTDRRIAAGQLDSSGEVLFSAPAGRTAALKDLPGPLRDLAYAALRLCLLEKVAAAKRLPVIVDDAFAALDPLKRSMVAKMLKAIAAHGQVIHRIADAAPQGIADHVVQA
ncbi:MAG: hypothetical protein E6J61_00635 [Deltaproteobacteria bacterium]|nr:MAG: hypothetical protein E6J61_00635 [Deltaproteobacteria bacterium]